MNPFSDVRTSQHLLETVVNSAPVVLFALDAEGVFTLSQGRGLEVLGLKPGDVVGRSIFDVYQHSARIVGDVQRALHGETVDSLTHVAGHSFEVHYTPVRDAAGNITGVTGVATNITELHTVTEQLRLRDRAIAASRYGITIADMRLPDQPLIYVNDAFLEMSGYTRADVLNRNCRFLQADDRDQPARDEIRAAIHEGRPTTVLLRNYRLDGTMFYNELHLSPIFDDRGILTHYVGLQTDVTERVRDKEQIEAQNEALRTSNAALALARQKAEDATRLKSQFLATMSHELRTPLNAIIGYTDIVLAGMTGELNDEQRDTLARILANADNLLTLINSLLDLSKIEAGRMEVVNKPFKPAEWIAGIAQQTRGLAEDKGLRFEHKVDERLPETLIGDPARIKQVAINLLSNAIKFTDSGAVRIEMRTHNNDAWKLIVSDTGIGIPPHMQETIFDEFRQVDGTSQRAHGGTGLGLAIVRKLAMMMGGNVRLQSQVGQGSTFTVFLPLAVPETAS